MKPFPLMIFCNFSKCAIFYSALYLFLDVKTATPGKVLPSSHSRKAPPAVEIYVNLSADPLPLSAETVSPPPATDNIFPD